MNLTPEGSIPVHEEREHVGASCRLRCETPLRENTRFLLSDCSGNGKLASWAAVVGFLVMMSLDVGLG